MCGCGFESCTNEAEGLSLDFFQVGGLAFRVVPPRGAGIEDLRYDAR